MKKHILLVLCILCSTLCAEKIPLELFFNNPQKTAPQISPDGSKLSYLAPDSNNVLNVFLENGNQITQDTKRGIRSYVWHYDNEQILYIQDKDGDENWHLFQTNIKTGKTTDLTPFDGVRAEILAYEPEFPNEMLITLNKENRSLFDVYHLNLDTAELLLDTQNPGDVVGWTCDPHLTVRASLRYDKEANALISIRENKNSPWKQFLKYPLTGDTASIVSFSKDGRSLLMITNLESNTTQLVEVDLTTNTQSVIAQ
ncbi:MAG TPA: hypothetical protein VN457_02340, partial [Chlamydiales bacterium]|nr:hypothetical protein [Chlamydiales bacterium]